MRVLVISGDKNALNPATPVGKRIEEYRRTLGELRMLIAAESMRSIIAVFFKGILLMRRQSFDVITAQSPEHWMLAWIFSRLFNVPWQAQVHTDIFNPYFRKQSWKNKIRVLCAKFLLSRADGIRVVSERIKRSLVSRIKNPSFAKASADKQELRITILPIWIDIEKFKNAQPNNEYPGEFLILTVARLEPEKNLPLAIRALAGVIQKHPDKKVRYVIIGTGSQKKHLQTLITNYQLPVTLKEADSAELPGWYKRANLFLLTSNYEGYGMAPVEAAAAGTPIVMTDAGIALGDVVPINDQNALYKAILRQIEGGGEAPALPRLPNKETYLEEYKRALEKLL